MERTKLQSNAAKSFIIKSVCKEKGGRETSSSPFATLGRKNDEIKVYFASDCGVSKRAVH